METVRRFISFVKTHPNCFERSLEIGHITGSAWLVNRNRTKVLLTHHKKLDKWLQLGGHADGQSNILSVALREAYEESGLEAISPFSKTIFDLDIHRIPKRGDIKTHFHYDVRFALQVTGSERFNVSHESNALSWVPILTLEDRHPDESILRMRKKWLTSFNPL
ncbi:MAG: NUDIX hydrolase [Nitrospiria bacterium]